MTYEDKIRIMMDYLWLKIEEKDYHGIADAAMDLRDLENYELGRRHKTEFDEDSIFEPIDASDPTKIKFKRGYETRGLKTESEKSKKNI